MALTHLVFEDSGQQRQHLIHGVRAPTLSGLPAWRRESTGAQSAYEVIDVALGQVLHGNVAEFGHHRSQICPVAVNRRQFEAMFGGADSSQSSQSLPKRWLARLDVGAIGELTANLCERCPCFLLSCVPPPQRFSTTVDDAGVGCELVADDGLATGTAPQYDRPLTVEDLDAPGAQFRNIVTGEGILMYSLQRWRGTPAVDTSTGELSDWDHRGRYIVELCAANGRPLPDAPGAVGPDGRRYVFRIGLGGAGSAAVRPVRHFGAWFCRCAAVTASGRGSAAAPAVEVAARVASTGRP